MFAGGWKENRIALANEAKKQPALSGQPAQNVCSYIGKQMRYWSSTTQQGEQLRAGREWKNPAGRRR